MTFESTRNHPRRKHKSEWALSELAVIVSDPQIDVKQYEARPPQDAATRSHCLSLPASVILLVEKNVSTNSKMNKADRYVRKQLFWPVVYG